MKRTPMPGVKTRGSTSGRPIMALLDLLGRRWVLRIVWELREDRQLRFRELQEACGVSPTVLNARLADLRSAGIVELGGDGYGLSGEGARLLADLRPLNDWAERWAARAASSKRGDQGVMRARSAR